MNEIHKFERQMDELLKVGRPIQAGVTQCVSENGHFVAVTFDDGFQSVLYNAVPVLRDRKIPATIFVTTGYLGKHPGWICDPKNPNKNEILLTEAQLKELPENLVTIGSHTVSHLLLMNVDENVVVREIVDSKKKLEKLLHKQITLISVPYGTFNKKYVKLFKAAGYQRVFLDTPTFPTTEINLYIMGRTVVSSEDWLIEFRLKLLGAYQWLPYAISIKNKLRGWFSLF
jgi:peptidoglycan/xylan/chitin deacetylase (PgdA/CDA1 family)